MTDDPTLDTLAERIAADLLIRAPHQPHARVLGKDLAAAYRVQDRVVSRIQASREWGTVTGFKVAMNSKALLERYGLDEPVSARIFSAGRHAGHTIDLTGRSFRQFAFEPEIAALIGSPLEPRAGGHDRESVRPAIERLVPALELLDQRGIVMTEASAADAIAQNISNAGIAIGGPGVSPAEYEALQVTTQVRFGDQDIASVTQAMPQHPLDVVAWMANHLAARGLQIEAGMVILCGTHTPIQHPPRGARIQVAMTGLGQVEVRLPG
ncbi:MAG: hypothetical protein RL322_306 [Pseudomonadota bacterium]|jgi:2-keto-4-pentenoate hydratase